MSADGNSFENGLANMRLVLEEYASDDFARKLADGAFGYRMSCDEQARCFDDMYLIVEPAGVSRLGLTDEIVAKLAVFRHLIFAAIDDGSDAAPNRQHFFDLYGALRNGTPPPKEPLRGPRWRSDSQIVASDDWLRIQERARELLRLLSSLRSES